MLEIKRNELNPNQFLDLYKSVGWEAPTLDQVKVALKNSLIIFSLEKDNRPIGMVRLIGDCGMSFYIKDFVIIPEYQHRGMGAILLKQVENYVRSSIPQGWAVSLELISSQQGQKFYEKYGYESKPNEWDGPGMMKMIRK